MSKKKLKALANLARAAGVCMAMLAVGTAIVWRWFPARVDALETWLHHRLVSGYHKAWNAARAERDPGRQAQQLEELLARLEHVRQDDHLAEVVLDCMHRLTDLARARGDLPAAVESMRAALVFDDHDVANAALLGDLMGQLPGKRQEGIDYLTQLAAQFPAHPLVVPVLARHLIAGGHARAALQVLEATEAATRSNLWTIRWDAGRGFDDDAQRADAMPSLDGEHFALRFLIPHEWTRLRFALPTFASLTLQAPKLTLVAGDARAVLDVATACTATGELLVGPDRLEAIGGSSPWFELALPPLGTGPVDVVLEARCRPNLSQALGAPATAPEMAVLADELTAAGALAQLDSLRRWRLAGLHGEMELFWRTASEGFDATRRLAAASPLRTGTGSKTFDVTFAVPAGATEVRFDLPPFVGYRYLLVAIEPAGLAQSGTNDIEIAADGVLLTTGSDPCVVFAAPAAGLTSLRIVGEVR